MIRVAALTFWIAGTAFAQLTAVEGTVKDAAGKLVPNASVQVIRQDVNRTYPAKTDKRGSYFQQGLPSGYYAIKVAVDGKEVIGVTGLRTQPGSPLEVNFDLRLSPQQQELEIKSSLKKLGAEWSTVKIMTVERQPDPAPAAPAPVPQPASIQPSGGGEAPRLFRTGVAALEAKKYEVAIAALTTSAEIDGSQAAVWIALAQTHLAIGTPAGIESALAAYTKAIALKPAEAGIHYNYAQALGKARKWPEMRAEMKKTAELDTGEAYRTYYNFGTILAGGGEQEAAAEAFRLAVVAAPNEPKNAESYYQVGLSMLSQAKVAGDGTMVPAPGMVELLQKYLTLAPNGANSQAVRELLVTLGVKK